LISFHAGNNRSNQSFFQITNRFDRTHSSRAQIWCYRKDFDGGDRGNHQTAQSMSAKKLTWLERPRLAQKAPAPALGRSVAISNFRRWQTRQSF
jgi:hypothetical protein